MRLHISKRSLRRYIQELYPSITIVKFWVADSKCGRASLGEEKSLGIPKIATTDDSIAQVHKMLRWKTIELQ